MKYTKEQRLDIGRQIYSGELTYKQGIERYGITESALRKYSRFYREANNLPPKKGGRTSNSNRTFILQSCAPRAIEDYESMSKEELIEELVKTRIRETRLKKGYEVKGDGSVIQYTKKNTK